MLNMSIFAFRKTWAVHFLFYAFLNRTSAALYSSTNRNKTLKTDIAPQMIQEILWKFKGNKVVDWDLNSGRTEYLQFIGRTSLVQRTGDLTICNLKPEDSGIYEAEVIINGNIHNAVHDLIVIDPVSDLSITCRSNDDQSATLLCQAEGADLTYSWSGPGLNTKIDGQIGPNITKEDNINSVYNCVVRNPVGEETKTFRAADCFSGKTPSILLAVGIALGVFFIGLACLVSYFVWKKKSSGEKSGKSEDGNDGTEDPLIGKGQRKDVLQNENAQVEQNKYVEELHESGEREIRKTVPLKPPKCSETKISQDHMSESNDGETERDQAVGSLRAQQGESCTWKNEKGTSPHERGERKTETAPKVPLKPPKHSEVQFSDSAGDTDGREERDRDGDQTVEGSLLSHQGESSVSMEVDDEGETERRGRGETDITLSPMSSQPNQPNRPPVPPKPKDLTPPSPLDYSLPNKGWGTNITSLESADSPSMPPSDDTDQPQPESDRSENGTPV